TTVFLLSEATTLPWSVRGCNQHAPPPSQLYPPRAPPNPTSTRLGQTSPSEAGSYDRSVLDRDRAPDLRASAGGGLDAGGAAHGGEGGPAGRRFEGRTEAAVGQERRVDAVREVAELLGRLLDVVAELLEHAGRFRGVLLGELAGQPELHGDGDQVLLGPVV